MKVRRTHQSVSGDFNGLVNGVFCEAEAYALYIYVRFRQLLLCPMYICYVPAQKFL